MRRPLPAAFVGQTHKKYFKTQQPAFTLNQLIYKNASRARNAIYKGPNS